MILSPEMKDASVREGENLSLPPEMTQYAPESTIIPTPREGDAPAPPRRYYSSRSLLHDYEQHGDRVASPKMGIATTLNDIQMGWFTSSAPLSRDGRHARDRSTFWAVIRSGLRRA